jgi:hypothetical protein
VPPARLEAAGGLVVEARDGVVRLGLGSPDWLGPGRFSVAGQPRFAALEALGDGADDLGPYASIGALSDDGAVRLSVRAYAHASVVVFRCEAQRSLDGLATGSFARPSYAWPACDPAHREPDGVPDGSRGFGYQYTEFALTTQSDASLSRWRLLPFRPAVVEPLGVVAPDGRCVLLAPIDAFHEQVIAVEDGIACGWHGDLERVPAGFATELAVIAGAGPRACLDEYGRIVQRRNATTRPRPDADALGSHVSYWTDNGSAYWYRTEPGNDTTTTLRSAIADLQARAIPVHAVQLDSWWYPHEVLRPFNTDDWVVPPTGLVRWEPREDVLPEGIPALREALGGPPLVTHCRHVSSSSPYVEEHECWLDGDRAHPTTADLYERWLDDAKHWGVSTFEHDWLVESFLGVRGLRAQPGRARAWQEGIDRAAAERDMTLQWCMATPADFAQTATLSRLTSIRTSGDHGYLIGPGELWAWFLLTNALARSLDLRPYKDVFLSDRSVPEHHAEVEALLAALSTGPVGIGDELGRADRDIVLRTCRDDGVIVRPDVPLAAVDRCFVEHPVARAVPLVAEAFTEHAAGRWVYAVTLNVSRHEQRLDEFVALEQLGASAPAGAVAVWDWRSGTAARLDAGGAWEIALDPLEWDLRVLAPILPSGLAVFGDSSRYAMGGRTRLAAVEPVDGGVAFTVVGAPGEHVAIAGWAEHGPPTSDAGALVWDDPIWRLDVQVPPSGATDVAVFSAALG